MTAQRMTDHRHRLAAATAALTVIVTGCAAPPVVPSPTTIEPTASPAPAAAPTAPVPVKTTLPIRSPGLIASLTWRPREPVRDLRELTEEEKLSAREADLVQLAQAFDLDDPPAVELERWIRHDERVPVLSQCYSEAGVQAIVDPMRYGFPEVFARYEGPDDEKTQRYSIPAYVCNARFSLDPTYQQPLTRDQARVSYEFETEFWVPCVRAAGFEVLDPPDRETAIDNALAGNYWPRWPDGKSPDEEYDAIYNACGDVMSPAAAFGY